MRITIATFLLFLYSSIKIYAQYKAQIYTGYLSWNNYSFLCIFEIETHHNHCKCFLSIPEQLIYRSESIHCKMKHDSIFIRFAQINGFFKGKIDANTQTIIGEWQENKIILPLNLKYSPEYIEKFFRPQHMLLPHSYVSKEILIQNKKEKHFISGTLTLPDTIRSHPLVILIAGSNATDRDQTVAGHKTFLVISDYLTRQGIAVFRYDKRGTGKSTGNFLTSTISDFASDVEHIISFFRKYPYTDAKKIGLLGHGEGSIIVMIVASRNERVRFIVTLGAPALNGMQILLRKSEDLLRAKQFNEEYIELVRNINFQLYNAAMMHKTSTSFRKYVTPLLQSMLSQYDDELYKKHGLDVELLIQQTAILFYSTAWLRDYLAMDPLHYIRKVKCPWLALHGEKDLQINIDENLPLIEQNYKRTKQNTLETKRYKNLNHMFQRAQTGHVEEYMFIPETIVIEVLEDIAHFIKTQIKLQD